MEYASDTLHEIVELHMQSRIGMACSLAVLALPRSKAERAFGDEALSCPMADAALSPTRRITTVAFGPVCLHRPSGENAANAKVLIEKS